MAASCKTFIASALTPKGIIDGKTAWKRNMYIYSIKGQPGTGGEGAYHAHCIRCRGMGLYTEQYHCPLNGKMDMLIIPELGKAVMNTNPPEHEIRDLA